MTTAAQELRLAFGFVPPELVYTTTIADQPVANAPKFFVMNAALPGGETLIFRNPAGLTPDSELPGLGSADRTLDRFYVFFPWGDHTGALCTKEEANGIGLVCLSDAWNVQPMSSSKVGRYWILFPKDEARLAPQESVMFAFAAIVTVSPFGAPDAETLLYLEHPLPDGSNDVHTAPLTKRAPRPTVTSFSGSPMTVAKGGEVRLAWRTMGARRCTLEPGAVKLDPAGELTVHPPHTTTYTLIATDGSEPGPDDNRQEVSITVVPVAIDRFEASPARSSEPGAAVSLVWETRYASGASIDQGIGPVPVSGSVTVTPRRTTTYTLTATGEDGPVHASTKVVVPPGVRIAAHLDREAMEAVLDWDTENCVSCRLVVKTTPGRIVLFDGEVELSGRDVRFQRLPEMGVAASLTGRALDGAEVTDAAWC